VKTALTSLLSLLLVSFFLVAAGSSERLSGYVAHFDKIQRDVKAAKGDQAKLGLLEKGVQIFQTLAKDDPSDFLARSFAGAVASQRSLYISNLGDKAKNAKEAIPLLDDAVRDAKLSHNDPELLQAFRIRAETYSSLPTFFNKSEIAVQDSKAALELGIKLKLSPEKMFSLKQLRVRALKNAIKPAKSGKAENKGSVHDAELRAAENSLDEAK
jgi:hypothetical protein